MNTGSTNYYLLVYEPATSKLQVDDLGSDETAAAMEYTKREHLYRDRPDVEVVLVGADSLETIKKTHSHYFAASVASLLGELEADLTAA